MDGEMMTIVEALKTHKIRKICNRNINANSRWLYWNEKGQQFVVRQQERGSLYGEIILETDNEELAVEALIGDEDETR